MQIKTIGKSETKKEKLFDGNFIIDFDLGGWKLHDHLHLSLCFYQKNI